MGTEDYLNMEELITSVFSEENVQKRQQAYTDIVAKYYGDPDFKARVDADPTGVLRAEGMEIPDGASVKLVFNTDKLIHIVLPMTGQPGE